MKWCQRIFLLVALATVALVLLGPQFHNIHHSPKLQNKKCFNSFEKLQQRSYKEGSQLARSKCYLRGTEKVTKIHIHTDSKLAYCPVAKIGCTFWKRIFLFLHNETGTPVSSPLQIPRQFVHYGRAKGAAAIDWTAVVKANMSQTYTKFLFGRDPYSRLWSAYLDKFLLPDFWRTEAKRIIDKRVNATERAKNCRDDISFEEFLNYVLSGSSHRQHANEHWKPVKFTCDPCVFKPDIIGRHERFSDDAKYILKDTELSWVMDTFDRDVFVTEELNMLIDYNFQLVSSGMYTKCVDDTGIAKLLWRVFQINGYLPEDVNFSTVKETLHNNFSRASFKQYAVNMYTSASHNERRLWKSQKRASLVSAYRKVPGSVIDSLIIYYKDDFDMFGYDTNPPV